LTTFARIDVLGLRTDFSIPELKARGSFPQVVDSSQPHDQGLGRNLVARMINDVLADRIS